MRGEHDDRQFFHLRNRKARSKTRREFHLGLVMAMLKPTWSGLVDAGLLENDRVKMMIIGR